MLVRETGNPAYQQRHKPISGSFSDKKKGEVHQMNGITLPTMNAATIPPVTTPVETCAWCWSLLHPGQPFPEQQSSTCCSEHSALLYARYVASRVAKQAEERIR